ncbi:MAG: AAA family ATPase, partial [Bradymonadaceae bacterium]
GVTRHAAVAVDDAAQSLGSRLFDDDDTPSDTDEPVDEAESSDATTDAPGGVSDADEVDEAAEAGADTPESSPSSRAESPDPPTGEEESESADLAGGRATTMPPSEETRRTRTEGWDPSLAERYTLDEEECPNLAELGRNITREAAEGRIDRIVGRDEEITQLIDIVGKRRANNPILFGEPGVGKTAIVEGLAREFVRMASDDNDLGRRAIIELELGRVLSGTQMRGALSERLLGIKQEVEAAQGDIIVFLDEIHGWMDAGGSDGGDAAGELKTAMARGRFPCIGATTNDEFREFIEADPAFERRFQNVLVDEPDTETAIEINEGIQPHYEDHHDVEYTDDALAASVRMSRRYIHDRRLPDKAISVLDLAGSRAARRGNDTVGRREIAEVVAETAGLPIDRLTQDDRQRFLDIEKHLRKKIVGQRHVIDTVAEVLRRNYAGFRGNRPIGSLLFLGPTGVGKTETVKVLADFLFHDRDAVVQIDMSEYMKSHSVSRFVGAPPGYVGHGQGGQLTEAIRRRPYQIVLLDELEKAHKDVLNVLLQLFEEGTLTDGKGRTVDFSNALIVMTSNLGSDLFSGDEPGGGDGGPIGFGAREVTAERSNDTLEHEHAEVEDDVLQAARDHLSPELWNRIDEKLVFMPLSRSEIADIARLQLENSAERIRDESGIEMEYGSEVIDHLIDNGGYDPELGARPMRQTIQRLVEGTVAREILRGDVERGDTVRVVCEGGEIRCAE